MKSNMSCRWAIYWEKVRCGIRGRQALYWVDIESSQIFRYDPAKSQHEMVQMDIAVGALAFPRNRRPDLGDR